MNHFPRHQTFNLSICAQLCFCIRAAVPIIISETVWDVPGGPRYLRCKSITLTNGDQMAHHKSFHESYFSLCTNIIINCICLKAHDRNKYRKRFHSGQGAVSIRKTVLPGMAIPMLKIRRPNGRLIFNMEIAIRR